MSIDKLMQELGFDSIDDAIEYYSDKNWVQDGYTDEELAEDCVKLLRYLSQIEGKNEST